MNSYYYDLLQKHINTHTEHSSEDRSAVHYLESVLNPGGRINTSFPVMISGPTMMEHLNMFQIQRYPNVQNKILLFKSKELIHLLNIMERFHIV